MKAYPATGNGQLSAPRFWPTDLPVLKFEPLAHTPHFKGCCAIYWSKSVSANLARFSSLFVASLLASLLFACGGNGSSVTLKTQANSVTPALGATYNADVYVYASDAITLLGQGKTDGTTGKSNITLTAYTPNTPVIVKVVLDPAKGSTYYDENQPTLTSVAPTAKFTMLSVLPSATSGQEFSANPLTNMAANFAGISADNLGSVALGTALVADKVYEGVAKTNLVLGLPPSTNILAPVTPATKAQPTPSGTLSHLLVVMSTVSTGETPLDPIQRAAKLAEAIKSDGTIDPAKSSAFSSLNTALAQTSNLGLTLSTPKITNADIQGALTAAKEAASKAVSSYTGSLTGGN